MGNWRSQRGESGEAEEILGWKFSNLVENCKLRDPKSSINLGQNKQ